MNRNTFVFLMIFEGFFALAAMGLLFSDVGALIYPISLAIFAAVLAPFCLALKKTEEEAKKRKLRLCMVLLMLIPIVTAAAAIGYVVVALMMYYA